MSRIGKIARLPEQVREKLNARLADNEEGASLLDWLNALPGVKEVLAADFNGVPISRQNLSEWRLGGFLEWQARRDLVEQSRSMAECGDEIENASEQDGLLVDSLASVVAGRMAVLLARWPEGEDPKYEAECRRLRGLTQDVARLQRSMHRAERSAYDLERLAQEQEEKELEKYKQQLIATCLAQQDRPMQEALYGAGESGERMALLIEGIKSARDMEGVGRAVQAAKDYRPASALTQPGRTRETPDLVKPGQA
jgi:hypothetical protein